MRASVFHWCNNCNDFHTIWFDHEVIDSGKIYCIACDNEIIDKEPMTFIENIFALKR